MLAVVFLVDPFVTPVVKGVNLLSADLASLPSILTNVAIVRSMSPSVARKKAVLRCVSQKPISRKVINCLWRSSSDILELTPDLGGVL